MADDDDLVDYSLDGEQSNTVPPNVPVSAVSGVPVVGTPNPVQRSATAVAPAVAQVAARPSVTRVMTRQTSRVVEAFEVASSQDQSQEYHDAEEPVAKPSAKNSAKREPAATKPSTKSKGKAKEKDTPLDSATVAFTKSNSRDKPCTDSTAAATKPNDKPSPAAKPRDKPLLDKVPAAAKPNDKSSGDKPPTAEMRVVRVAPATSRPITTDVVEKRLAAVVSTIDERYAQMMDSMVRGFEKVQRSQSDVASRATTHQNAIGALGDQVKVLQDEFRVHSATVDTLLATIKSMQRMDVRSQDTGVDVIMGQPEEEVDQQGEELAVQPEEYECVDLEDEEDGLANPQPRSLQERLSVAVPLEKRQRTNGPNPTVDFPAHGCASPARVEARIDVDGDPSYSDEDGDDMYANDLSQSPDAGPSTRRARSRSCSPVMPSVAMLSARLSRKRARSPSPDMPSISNLSTPRKHTLVELGQIAGVTNLKAAFVKLVGKAMSRNHPYFKMPDAYCKVPGRDSTWIGAKWANRAHAEKFVNSWSVSKVDACKSMVANIVE